MVRTKTIGLYLFTESESLYEGNTLQTEWLSAAWPRASSKTSLPAPTLPDVLHRAGGVERGRADRRALRRGMTLTAGVARVSIRGIGVMRERTWCRAGCGDTRCGHIGWSSGRAR